ncbi:metal-sensitive transcriptional regulator [Actinocorallia glomerata]|uniref:Metal-sensitive transcriptional regulator n=3 Tax=Actinomycetes TaxID=1760 RepID=A0ABP6M044_9MICC
MSETTTADPSEGTASTDSTATPEPREHAEHTHHGYMSDKSRYLSRLRRIEGQARGIHRMIEDDTYCIDILTQISAMTSALENVGLALLDDHLKHCVAGAVAEGGADGEEKLKEASDAIRRLVKS